jgi:hypothetical protein
MPKYPYIRNPQVRVCSQLSLSSFAVKLDAIKIIYSEYNKTELYKQLCNNKKSE